MKVSIKQDMFGYNYEKHDPLHDRLGGLDIAINDRYNANLDRGVEQPGSSLGS